VSIPGEKCTKWDGKSRECIFMGYMQTTIGYKLFDPDKPTDIVPARDVIFIEEKWRMAISHS
jgi:hypothetical protein